MSPEPFAIAWTPTAKRALGRLSEKVAAAAVEFIYGTLAENPHRVGKPLRRELEGLHSARRGDFRIAYQIADAVTILAIEHRADIYRARRASGGRLMRDVSRGAPGAPHRVLDPRRELSEASPQTRARPRRSPQWHRAQ